MSDETSNEPDQVQLYDVVSCSDFPEVLYMSLIVQQLCNWLYVSGSSYNYRIINWITCIVCRGGPWKVLFKPSRMKVYKFFHR